MEIGKEEEKTITVEPIVDPVPRERPAPDEPAPLPEPEREPEKVPA